MKGELTYFEEPNILFRYGQELEDPRDGLSLFGPLDEGKPYGIRVGVVGTASGIERYKNWVTKLQAPIYSKPEKISRPPFPGFEAAFQIPWNPTPEICLEVSSSDLNKAIHLADKYQRVYEAVKLYSERILTAIREEEASPDFWCIIIPDDVRRYCRPKSTIEPDLKIGIASTTAAKHYKNLQSRPSLFAEENEMAKAYFYDVNFHNQLKARLLEHNAPTQILRESTIAHQDFLKASGKPIRDLDSQLSDVAWHISTAAFYKSGGRPWKIASIRDGVCYIGLVFKLDERYEAPQSACCAAQMFLDSGDGVVFKGNVGPWYNPKLGEYHLTRNAARELVSMAIKSYKDNKGQAPKELFLHGRVMFNEEEWSGFKSAVDSTTNIVGIKIRDDDGFKLYTAGRHALLRGLSYLIDDKTAYLWTRGLVPRLQTYPGREVPRPLRVDICQGRVSIEIVLKDILALTKLNYNACRHSDGYPVTLKFANSVGEILTAGPMENIPPLQFRHYI